MKKKIKNKESSSVIYFFFKVYIFLDRMCLCVGVSLHEHTAFCTVLPQGRGGVQVLGPAGQGGQGGQGQLGDPLQAPAGAASLQLGLVWPSHRRQRGDVEHVPHAVL